MSNQLAVRTNGNSALALAEYTERYKLLVANGKRLTDQEAQALAQYSVTTGLDAFMGECYYMPGAGPIPGIYGYRRKADEQLQQEARRAAEPLARFWCEPEDPTEEETGKLNAGDIGVKMRLHDTLTKNAWERRILSHYIELVKAGMKDGAIETARELVGPEPTWTGIGIVRAGENFGGDKMPRYERACKRGEKAAIKKRFRVQLPEPENFDDAIEGTIITVSETTPVKQPQRSEAEIMQELGFDVEQAKPEQPQPKPEQNENERPYPPDVLRQKIASRAVSKYQTAIVSDKQRGLVAMLIDKAFAGADDREIRRHAVQAYLFGLSSLRDVHPSAIKSALDWLNPAQDSGGDYNPDPMAVKEIQLAYTAAIVAQGQQPLL